MLFSCAWRAGKLVLFWQSCALSYLPAAQNHHIKTTLSSEWTMEKSVSRIWKEEEIQVSHGQDPDKDQEPDPDPEQQKQQLEHHWGAGTAGGSGSGSGELEPSQRS